MKPERWKQIDQLFSEALNLDIEKRPAFLDKVCSGDEQLRKEIESLLQSDQQSTDLIHAIPASIAADMVKPQRLEIAESKSIGPYKILSLIGVGGMGEVYRATDPRLGREVALKILPVQFSEDRDRLRRFQQEARAAGLLNHPNIVAIYDAGSENGSPYLVSELLQGQSLREKINGNPLAFRKAIEYAVQIARGLSAAHEKGIVHRDLKPENIFITREGVAKILDFGLAKLTHAEISNTSMLETEIGIVMGTVVYMSPEQVRGAKVDHRSDIFAFGAILYEMLSGKRPFQRESQIEVMHGIIKEDPVELTALNVAVPPSLDRIVRRCLEKSPDQRFQSASDLAFALETLSSPTITTATSRAVPITKWNLPWLLTAISLLAAVTLGVILYQTLQKRGDVPNTPAQMFSISLPEKTVIDNIALSPDGKYLAYAPIDRSGNSSLHLRSLDSIQSQEIPGTESAISPFWSRDSKSIGFFSNHQLKIVKLGGGPPRTLCDVEMPKGGTWSQDDVILFAENFSGLYRISAMGGEAARVTSLDVSQGELTQRFPFFLPDGKHFFYIIGSQQEEHKGLYVGSLDGKVKKRLRSDFQKAEYVDPGFAFFLISDRLMVQRFNLQKLEFEGEPIQIVEGVFPRSNIGAGLFSISQNNILGFSNHLLLFESRPSWFDRSGKPIDKFQNEFSVYGDPNIYKFGDLSADEKQLLIFGNGCWILDLLNGQPTRFAITNENPTIFSIDGNHVFYADSDKDGNYIMQRLTNGSGKPQKLYRTDQSITELSLSPDGRNLLFNVWDLETKLDQWIMPLSGDWKPFPYLTSHAKEEQAQFSPDGKWIAYVSDATGIPEVYVQSFPIDVSGKWQISFEGGQQPRWRKDGRELFYLTLDKKMMAVEVESRDSFYVGASKLLFQTTAHPDVNLSRWSKQYFPADNGKRFLINATVDSPKEEPITILLNWKSLLKKQ